MKKKIINIKSIFTWCPIENKLLNKKNVEILIKDSIITEIGNSLGNAEVEIDANGAVIIPGFVDSHTHPIFSGNRSNEFSQRILGKSYEEIAFDGGGINSSIHALRSSNEDELYKECLERINYFLEFGTTTIEAKSGYGLTVKDEIKSLRVIKRLNDNSPLDIIPTFMGAHSIPPEYINNPSKYIDLICEEMIPQVAEEKLAVYCDVFCEKGYFSLKSSRYILETAKKYGLKIRLHADEFIDSGAANLAAELGAISADHLMEVNDSAIKKMSKNNVIATLLPGTTLFLGKKNYANGRKIIDYGCEVAIATDYNPGSCTIQSMPLIISLSSLYCGLSIEEAFKGATWNAAKSLCINDKIGSISKGFQADLIFLNIESLDEIPYWMDSNRIFKIMKSGNVLN